MYGSTNGSGVGNGSAGGGIPFPPMIGVDVDNNVKLAQERYEVYVNGDFVGHKVLLTQVDSPKDVVSFLKSRGFDDFRCEVEGDHCNIEVPDDSVADTIKDHLSVYLKTR